MSLECVEPVFTGTYDEDSLFFECGQEVLTSLHRTLANEPISLMLTDADGLVLNRLSGDTALLRALDAVHLAPGFAFSEREAGTNGLGLALADRVPSVVRAEEHYSLSLCTYTCAAVPVLDPVTGRLEGGVNLTTWSRSSSDLLLALAQSAASNTAALMLARSRGRRPGRPRAARSSGSRLPSPAPAPCGTCHRPGPTASRGPSGRWPPAGSWPPSASPGRAGPPCWRRRSATSAPATASSPPAPGVPGRRLLASLWTPELGKPNTAVVVATSSRCPSGRPSACATSWPGHDCPMPARCAAGPGPAARRDGEPAPRALLGHRRTLRGHPRRRWPPWSTRSSRCRPCGTGPTTSSRSPGTSRRARGREVELTPAAVHALTDYGWPGNVDQLNHVIREAATRTDLIDVRHLPSEVLSGTARRLTRIEAFEREEIVRVLTRPGTTMKEAAEELGMSRATIYRKMAQYDLHPAA